MHLARSLAFTATILVTLGQATAVVAQESPPENGAKEPSSTGKGIVGGTLLGAEIVLLTEAAIDVSPDWLYYVGGAAGAVGGGIAGYYLEDSLSSQGNMFMLAGGMLLVIPTTVAVLSATAYEQSAEYTQDRPPSDEPVADPVLPSSPAATTPTPSTDAGQPPTTQPPEVAPTTHNVKKQRRHRALPPPALVGVDAQKRIHLGIPAVEVRGTFSRVDMERFGVQQRSELRIPLLRLVF